MKTSFVLWAIFFSLCFWSLYGLAQAKFAAHYAYLDFINSTVTKFLFGN